MKSLLSRFILSCICFIVFAVCMSAMTTKSEDTQYKVIRPSVTQAIDDQLSTISELIPQMEAAIHSPLPIPPETSTEEISTPTPLPTETDDEERAEEIVEEPIRENKLYYVLDNGWRCDCDIAYQDYLWEKCVEYGIEDHYELMMAMMYHESNFKPRTISATNDYGLFQINACNHNWLKETLGITDFLDPYNSIDAGVYIMSGYLIKYNDVHMALMCYNMGEGGARRSGATSSTYSRGVVADMDKLQLLEE